MVYYVPITVPTDDCLFLTSCSMVIPRDLLLAPAYWWGKWVVEACVTWSRLQLWNRHHPASPKDSGDPFKLSPLQPSPQMWAACQLVTLLTPLGCLTPNIWGALTCILFHLKKDLREWVTTVLNLALLPHSTLQGLVCCDQWLWLDSGVSWQWVTFRALREMPWWVLLWGLTWAAPCPGPSWVSLLPGDQWSGGLVGTEALLGLSRRGVRELGFDPPKNGMRPSWAAFPEELPNTEHVYLPLWSSLAGPMLAGHHVIPGCWLSAGSLGKRARAWVPWCIDLDVVMVLLLGSEKSGGCFRVQEWLPWFRSYSWTCSYTEGSVISACKLVFIASPEWTAFDEEMSEPLAFQPVQHGSSWPGPRASVFLGFCRLEELRGGWRQGAACVRSDQWQLQERRVIKSFCFAFAPLWRLL